MPETRDPRNDAGMLASVTLSPCPERKLIRLGGSHRHVDFRLAVSAAARTSAATRAPVRLALVLDRSGSMSGGKLETASFGVSRVFLLTDGQANIGIVDPGAIDLVRCVARRIGEYAGADPELIQAIAMLAALERELDEAELSPMRRKEVIYASMASSRHQKDYRQEPH